MNSYYYYWKGKWYWWSRWGWSEPNDGRRYPVVDIVILTKGSFKYAMGNETFIDLPPTRDSVYEITDMSQWQLHWDGVAPFNKLVVFEFYEKNSSLCKAMDKPLEKLAERYKDKADFCKLNVDNFEFLARLCGVEGAYPTFALFKNCKQVGKVVGPKEDELEQSIQRALT